MSLERRTITSPTGKRVEVIPDPKARDMGRTGTLVELKVSEVSFLFGFEPNRADDPIKVKFSWGARVGDEVVAVWDYKGSHVSGVFSTYGPSWALREIFGENFQP